MACTYLGMYYKIKLIIITRRVGDSPTSSLLAGLAPAGLAPGSALLLGGTPGRGLLGDAPGAFPPSFSPSMVKSDPNPIPVVPHVAPSPVYQQQTTVSLTQQLNKLSEMNVKILFLVRKKKQFALRRE